MYIQHCIITSICFPLLCCQGKKKKKSPEQPILTTFFSYWKPFVANDYAIYFTGHCRDIDKWGTPEGKVILNTSSYLTLAVFIEHKPSIPTASWITYWIHFSKSVKATFAIHCLKTVKEYYNSSVQEYWVKVWPDLAFITLFKNIFKTFLDTVFRPCKVMGSSSLGFFDIRTFKAVLTHRDSW